VYVSVSNRSFPDLSLEESLQKLADLEYTSSEIAIGSMPCDLPAEMILRYPEEALRRTYCCRSISPMLFFFDVDPEEPLYYEKFEACCRLAKRMKIIVVTVRSAPQGTPYNEEIERLRRLNAIGIRDGILIGLLTERGRIAESCDSIRSLCKSVPEMSITLDPSQFIFGRPKPVDYDSIIPLVCHTRLRDTTADALQVQIGQGVLEYNKLVVQLTKCSYRGALGVDLSPLPGIDTEGELRKMRLLLDSLI